MIQLRKNHISKFLALLISVLMLQQGVISSKTGKAKADHTADDLFEGYVVELLEWVCEEDIDLRSNGYSSIPVSAQQQEPESEKDTDETEDQEAKNLITQQGLIVLPTNIMQIHNRHNFLSRLFYTVATPPPEIV